MIANSNTVLLIGFIGGSQQPGRGSGGPEFDLKWGGFFVGAGGV